MSIRTIAVQFCLSLGLIGYAITPAQAQARDTTTLSPEMQYDLMKKSVVIAGTLEYLAPVGGHTYAGNWKRGVLPAAATVAGGVTMLIAFDHSLADWGEPDPSDSDEALFWVGAGLLFGGRVWGVISAMHTASVYNKRLRERLHIERQADGRIGIGVDLSLGRVATW